MVWRRRLLLLWAVISALWVPFALRDIYGNYHEVQRAKAEIAESERCYQRQHSPYGCRFMLDGPQLFSIEQDILVLTLPPAILLFLGASVCAIADAIQRRRLEAS